MKREMGFMYNAWLYSFILLCPLGSAQSYDYPPKIIHAYSRKNNYNLLDESELRGPRNFDPFRPLQYPSLASSGLLNSLRTLPESYLPGLALNDYIHSEYSPVESSYYNPNEYSGGIIPPSYNAYSPHTPVTQPPPVNQYPLTSAIPYPRRDDGVAECEPGGVPKWDVLIMIDASWSVGQVNFELIRDFLKAVVKELPSGTHLALVQFSDWARTEFSFDHFHKANEALDYLNIIQYMGGGTRVGNALDYVIKEELQYTKGDRPHIPNAVVVITDGKSEDTIIPSATFLRDQGVKMIAVGVTDAVDDAQLLQIAGSPNHIFKLPNFKYFNDAFKKVLLAQLCVRPFIRRKNPKYAHHHDSRPEAYLPRIGSQTPKSFIYSPTIPRCRRWDITVVFDGIVVPPEEFEHVRHFLVSLLLQLPDTARLNFINYKSNFDINAELLFRDYRTKQDIIDSISYIRYKPDEQVRLGAALEEVLYVKHISDRKNAADAMILITNGASFDDPGPAAEKIRIEGMKSIVIGIGQKLNPNELNTIAGHVSRVYRLPFFHNLNFHDKRIIAEQLCVQEPENPAHGIQYGILPVGPVLHVDPIVQLNSIGQPPPFSSQFNLPAENNLPITPPIPQTPISNFPDLEVDDFLNFQRSLPPVNSPFKTFKSPITFSTKIQKFESGFPFPLDDPPRFVKADLQNIHSIQLPDSTLFQSHINSHNSVPSRQQFGLSNEVFSETPFRPRTPLELSPNNEVLAGRRVQSQPGRRVQPQPRRRVQSQPGRWVQPHSSRHNPLDSSFSDLPSPIEQSISLNRGPPSGPGTRLQNINGIPSSPSPINNNPATIPFRPSQDLASSLHSTNSKENFLLNNRRDKSKNKSNITSKFDENKFKIAHSAPDQNKLNNLNGIAHSEISSGRSKFKQRKTPPPSPFTSTTPVPPSFTSTRFTPPPMKTIHTTVLPPRKGGIFVLNGTKYNKLNSSSISTPSNELFPNSQYPDLSRDHPFCCGWAANNECQLNSKWMFKNCPGACNLINGCMRLECEDKQLDCEDLALKGNCATEPHFMQYVCRASCSAC